jgi:hypothetical protein
MFRQGPIPAFVHGILEYLAGALLIAAPFIFSFTADAATAASIVAGVILLAYTASTAMTTGLIKSIPVSAHVVLDYILAALLIASPFIFSFSDDNHATPFFIITGVVYLLVTIATRFVREDRPSRRSRRSADPAPRS